MQAHEAFFEGCVFGAIQIVTTIVWSQIAFRRPRNEDTETYGKRMRGRSLMLISLQILIFLVYVLHLAFTPKRA